MTILTLCKLSKVL